MRKPNNKGFSMTEVIVAVAVFLILAIPIFSQLVLSVKNNSKAKASQYGINVAESEMELFKSLDLNTIAKIYDSVDGTDSSGNTITTYTLPDKYKNLTSGTILEDEFMANPYATLSLLEFAKKVQKFEVDSTGVCTFTYKEVLTNEEVAGAGDVTDKTFDVQVTLDPTAYDGDTGEKSYNAPKDGGVQSFTNEEQYIIGANLDEMDQDVRDNFWEKVVLTNLTPQERFLYEKSNKTQLPTNYRQYNTFYMTRTAYITIELNPEPEHESKGKYRVIANYEYDCSYKVAGSTITWNESKSERVGYYNTVPDIKIFYTQLIVNHVKPSGGDIVFDDKIVFTNKLEYEKKHTEGSEGAGYQYYYTNSDLYLIFNNTPGTTRGYSSLNKCEILFGSEHEDTQKPLNVYYTQSSDDNARSIENILYCQTSLEEQIKISSADKKVVVQDFQPIYDVEIIVSPENGNGMTTKMEGTRGQ